MLCEVKFLVDNGVLTFSQGSCIAGEVVLSPWI
jgi:hypothetical protein